MKFSRSFLPVVAVAATVPVAAQAQAAGTAPDLTSLTAAIDYSTIAPAILAVGALGMSILLAMVAVKYMRRGARSA